MNKLIEFYTSCEAYGTQIRTRAGGERRVFGEYESTPVQVSARWLWRM